MNVNRKAAKCIKSCAVADFEAATFEGWGVIITFGSGSYTVMLAANDQTVALSPIRNIMFAPLQCFNFSIGKKIFM